MEFDSGGIQEGYGQPLVNIFASSTQSWKDARTTFFLPRFGYLPSPEQLFFNSRVRNRVLMDVFFFRTRGHFITLEKINNFNTHPRSRLLRFWTSWKLRLILLLVEAGKWGVRHLDFFLIVEIRRRKKNEHVPIKVRRERFQRKKNASQSLTRSLNFDVFLAEVDQAECAIARAECSFNLTANRWLNCSLF